MEPRNLQTSKQVETHFSETSAAFDSFYKQDKGLFSKLIDGIFRRSMRLRFERVIEQVVPYENKTVLDVGCGAGRYPIALALKGIRQALGIDFAEGMIARANDLAKQFDVQDTCRFERSDFMQMNVGERFDHVIAMGVMDYIENPVPFVQKMIQACKTSVLVSFPSARGFIQWCRKHYFYKIKKCPVFFYTLKDVETIAAKAGAAQFTVHKLAKDYFLEIGIGL
jgi:2-polyprenyl-3-methyl-5-hydroxy-6-metoxy-1,4-benzoquinol methylase